MTFLNTPSKPSYFEGLEGHFVKKRIYMFYIYSETKIHNIFEKKPKIEDTACKM